MRLLLILLITCLSCSAEGLQNWYFDFHVGKTTFTSVGTLPNGDEITASSQSTGAYNSDKTVFTETGVTTYGFAPDEPIKYKTIWKINKQGEIVGKSVENNESHIVYLILNKDGTATLKGRVLGKDLSHKGSASLNKTKTQLIAKIVYRDKTKETISVVVKGTKQP